MLKVTLDGYPLPIKLEAATEMLYANTAGQEESLTSNTCLQIPLLQEEAGTTAELHILPRI